MRNDIKLHLVQGIIPFWKTLRDDTYGGYYGFMGFDRNVDKKAVKGCILNSRITWFFSSAYQLLGDASLLEEARHGYRFLKEHCLDQKNGGVFWSVGYDGSPEDTTKHTYNQAFAIYALSSYYEASGDEESIHLAEEIYHIIETRCMDEEGYLEAFDSEFTPVENDKLSENGVIADKTMNTLLHVLEAYTEFYRVTQKEEVKKCLMWILDVIAEKIYNPSLHRLEVFFDAHYHSIIDLHSYGHDIEAAWLVDRCLDVIDEPVYIAKIQPIIRELTRQVYETAYDGHSLSNECEKGVVDTNRVWWVQAEAIVGFLNGYQNNLENAEYLDAARNIWQFIKSFVIDKRSGSEWYWLVDKDGRPYKDQPIVEPWKCPYHNGRMCIEVIRRTIDAS